MTITVISHMPASAGSPLGNATAAPLNAGLTEGEPDTHGFAALFAKIMNKAFPQATGQAQNLPTASDPSVEDIDPADAQTLLQSLPGKASRNQVTAQKTEEDPAEAPLVAALQAPLQPAETTVSVPAVSGRSQAALAAGTDKAPTELATLVSDQGNRQNPANLAANEQDFSRLLQPNQAATSTAKAETPAPQAPTVLELKTPLQDPRWSQEFGEKIVWMARHDQQQAQLTLNPAHLGPLQVNLNLEGNKAAAMFIAATPEAQQIIEDALPRLREMLAGAGVSLGQTQVGTQAQQQQQQSGQSRKQQDDAILDTGSGTLRPVQQGNGIVDLFA